MPHFISTLTEETTPLRHVWEHTVGSGHAALALRADWQRQLLRCRRELGFRYVRFHGLLSYPMDTMTCEKDAWLFSFFNVDQIFDYLLSIGMRPFVELSFTPDDLASGSKTVFHYRANVTPPRDYRQWSAMIAKLVRHLVDRYGSREVSQWFFEVWNEPNLTAFGTGRPADYFRLYRATVEAIKRVDPSLQVGGPATAKSAWIEEFVAHVDAHRMPADFISTHQYPTDAFGSPGDDTVTQLSKGTRGVMREKAQDARRQSGGRPLYYTEWNTSSNPRDHLHDEPFAAAFAADILMSVDDVVEGYSWWTFSDIFNENYMPSIPFQGGFGLLTIHDIAKPVYRAFELLHRLGSRRFVVDGLHNTVRASVLRREAGGAMVLLVNHALPRHAIETERVRVTLTQAPRPRRAYVERVDDRHANATRLWRDMRKPGYPSRESIERLDAASQLVREPLRVHYDNRQIVFEVTLPPHAIAAVTLECAPETDSAVSRRLERARR